MSSPAAASKSAAYLAALRAWVQALQQVCASLGALGAEVWGRSDAGRRAREKARELDAAVAAAETAVQGAADGGSLLALMQAGDLCGRAGDCAAGAVAAHQDPNVHFAAALNSSSSEHLRVLTRAMRAAAKAVQVRAHAAKECAATASAGTSPKDAAEAFAASGRGGQAVELYLGALDVSNAGSRARLEHAKDESLGLSRDSASAAAADTEALAALHPLQAACYYPPPASEGPAEATFRLGMPKARAVLRSDMLPLVDARAAQAFGPIAPGASGLNFNLARRLDTLRTVEIKAAPEAPEAPEAKDPTLVRQACFEYGPGVSRVAGVAGGGWWAPLAGPAPRTTAYARLSGDVITAGLAADQQRGWTPALAEQFVADVESGAVDPGVTSAELLTGALQDAFARAYDAAPPETLAAWRRLLYPRPGPSDYFAEAAAAAGEVAYERRMRRILGAESQALPYAAVEREARLSQALNSLAAARELRRAVMTAAAAFPIEDLGEAPVRRDRLLGVFKRIAAAVAAGGEFVCAAPILKVYAAERAPGAAR